MKALLLAAVAALVAMLLLSACGSGGRAGGEQLQLDQTAVAGGAARPFLLGLSSLPVEGNEDSYRDAFKLAGEAGEVILIQRTPPWEDFLPGGTISGSTERITRLEKELAHDNDVKLFLAIDPTVPGNRGQIAGLPEGRAESNFADPDLRSAFINYAKYLALNYKPAYMALGVEVDMYYAARGDGPFRNFLSLYFEAYDAVKSVSKDTLVFPTFQYEDMQGLLTTGGSQTPSWGLVKRFEPKIDLLAVSSFPSLVFDSIQSLPLDYYAALKNQGALPVALASVGWSSTQGSSDDPGETQQVVYLYRVLTAAQELKSPLLIWFLGRDPLVTPSAGFEPLATMGLQMADGAPKSAWRVWVSSGSRPPPGH